MRLGDPLDLEALRENLARKEAKREKKRKEAADNRARAKGKTVRYRGDGE